MNILFVCTANITRSAMCAAIMRKVVADKGLQTSFIVDSAGTEALVECPPDKETVEVCKAHGIDISAHRSQQVTDGMIRDSAIILCVAEPHMRIIRGIFPQWERKIQLLKGFGMAELPKNSSLEDPTGRAKRKYEQCFKEIEAEINRIFPILEQHALNG